MRRMRRALVLLLSAILIITACLPTAMTGLALENPDAETTAPVETDPAETTASADTEPGETDAAEPTDVPATEPGAPEGTEPAEPSGTEPTDGTIVDATEPAVTDPTATDPAQAETTEPGAADPTETAPQETEPAATEPVSGDTVYTIHFDLGGGSFAARKAAARSAAAAKQNTTSDGGSVTAAVGEDITLPEAPEKAERSFAGWLSARTGAVYGAGDSYVVAADDTLTAQWNMLQRLGVDAEPEDGSALKDAQQVTAAVSEAQQAGVESAVGSALGGDTVKTLDVLAADISFVGASGEELQPAEGESVPVTLTVPESYIDDDADFLVVYHMVQQADGSYFAEPVQYAACAGGSQELSFGATGFSIYAVASVGKRDTDTGSTLVKGTGSGNVTYEIQEEQSQVFFFKEDHTRNYKYHRYVWTVQGNDDTVRAYSTSIYFQDKDSVSDDSNNYQYPWLSVDALRPGEVTITVTYYCYNGRDWWKPYSGGTSGTMQFKLKVTEKEDGLAIVNQIPEAGTLKPVWRGDDSTVIDHYVWSKMAFYTYNSGDGSPEIDPKDSPVDSAARMADGSINVSIDGGGVTQEVDSTGKQALRISVYTCKAYDAAGNVVGEATHRVEYGENVLNGSFEYPAIPSGTGYAFANGTQQLFWRTTAPGDGSTLGQDVELGNDKTGNPYLISGSQANDGSQFAELNAEKAGTLYQDVLTAPGATLSWSFAHRSRRSTGTNVMYLVIAASKDAKNVTNQSQINALVRNYRGDGLDVSYGGGTYKLWKFEGNELYWQNHYGSYTVPDGQYSTRFFFASASGSTLGNLIDGIHFNESQRYVIEYYLNGTRLPNLTEISTAESDSVVVPAHTGDSALANAFLTGSTINGANYGGVTLSIKARESLDKDYTDCRNVLRLYYTTGTVSVRKVVEIEAWDDLTDKEKSNINNGENGYTAEFRLYDGSKLVAMATVTIDLIEYAQKTGVAVFMDAVDPTKPFAPERNHTYRVEELSKNAETDGMSHVYDLKITYDPTADGGGGGKITTNDAATGSCTVTNSYTLTLTDLTIYKQGWQSIDENQTFVYRVQGVDTYTREVDLTVTVHGNGSTTIKNLPAGTYKVTEIESWSWRYTPAKNGVEVDLSLDTVDSVTFTNTRASESGGGDHWRWLNGSSWKDNRWLNGEALGPNTKEGGEQNG